MGKTFYLASCLLLLLQSAVLSAVRSHIGAAGCAPLRRWCTSKKKYNLPQFFSCTTASIGLKTAFDYLASKEISQK